MVSKGRAAIAGVVAAAVALGVAELVAVFTGPRSAPLIAVGGVVVDSAPEPAKQFAIALFGVHDKTALLVGTGILLALFAALIGIGANLDRMYGYLGIGLFAAIGVAAALTRPHATWIAVLPTLIGSALALFVLVRLLHLAVAVAESPPRDLGVVVGDSPDSGVSSPPELQDRRGFVKWTAGIAVVAGVVGLGGRWLASRRTAELARSDVKLPAPANPAQPLPQNVDLAIAGLARYVTSNRDFYRIDTALVTPQVDPESWTLKIHGRVRNPFTLTFEQLLARPMVERYVTLACVSNEVGGDLISNARWLGVPVKEILAEADPEPGADQVVSRSVDGWTCGTPTAVLSDGRDALLAVGMNGEPLPVEHGFPVRMVTPGLYGYVSACKWLTELELTSFADFDAYWIRRGWSAQGPIKTQSRIDVPRSNAKVPAGEVVVAGVAWAQHRGITVVEVSTDNGVSWRQAELAGTVSPDTWRQWMLRWQATPGRYTLMVRAADTTGMVQSEQRVPVVPDGAEGWHTITVTVT
ncbi:MAG TPA: molybdopterin-binding oxidoreductase [Micromonosporaceae bacterium]|nr:molybdopterin-binding oxidoreductase [Micromonosporaceae bacterium]